MGRRLVILVGIGLALSQTSQPHGQVTTPPPVQRDGTFRQYGPGLLARVNYQTDSPSGYRIELWDLLVGPAKTSEPVKLPGGAVVEVRSGSGRALVDGQAREITGGATFVVHQGSSLALTNSRDDLALALRATVISRGAQ
jgi:hypothetical protein